MSSDQYQDPLLKSKRAWSAGLGGIGVVSALLMSALVDPACQEAVTGSAPESVKQYLPLVFTGAAVFLAARSKQKDTRPKK